MVSSGLKSVVLQLQRADGQYWNGRVYQRAPFDLRTRQLDRSFFALLDTLPSRSPDGRYTWTAIATDNAGNQARAGQTFVLDQTPPALLITSPAAEAGNTARLSDLGTISGRASGAVSVEVALKRADGSYWNRREYQDEPFFLEAALSNGAWSLSAGLPSGADLPPGNYVLLVRARDEAGNAGISSRAIVVTSSPAS